VYLYDITDCTSPKLLDTFDTEGWAVWIKIIGDTVYIADWEGGLVVLKIAERAED
jgi:hypothetical protein